MFCISGPSHGRKGSDFGAVQSFTFRGACMLVDISGFSKFSAAMCSNGVSGLDDLREVTNGFLGHFVKIVYQYDGDGLLYWRHFLRYDSFVVLNHP